MTDNNKDSSSQQQDEDERMMEAVNLTNSPMNNKKTNPTVQTLGDDAVYSSSLVPDESDNALENNQTTRDDSMEATIEDEQEEPIVGDTQEALSKLKASTSNFGKAVSRASMTLDEKIGFTKGVSQVATKVKQVDHDHLGVSQSAKQAGSSVGSWFSSMNEKYQISTKTSQLGGAVNERIVKPVLGEGEDSVVVKSKRNLQQLDESHGITKSTASTLASGVDYLTKSINTISFKAETNNDEPSALPESSLDLDKDQDNQT